MADEYLRTVNRLAKWRSVFAGRWLGTRVNTDPEAISVRDIYEKYLILRVEVNALAQLLDKHVPGFTVERFQNQIITECDHMQAALERQFPGMKATDEGIHFDLPRAAETMKDWQR